MSTIIYKCPCCGGPLAYGAASGKLDCAACGNSFDLSVVEEMNAAPTESHVAFDLPKESFAADETAQMHAYVCESCGAELLTEETTTATECPYCGSPAVLPNRIEGGVKPEYVVPFEISKEEAVSTFENYFKGKRLLPNIFATTRNRISELRRLYVPYWLFDCAAEGDISYRCERTRVERHGDWQVTRTAHYSVRRRGSMAFEAIPVDGSEKLDNKITESLEPYDLEKAVPFEPAVLAGAMADRADVDADACESRASERVENSVAETLRNTVHGYSTVYESARRIVSEGGKVTPVLMPVWLITTEKEGKTYTFAVNGQTGKLTCDVPTDKKKAFGWGSLYFAIVMALGVLIMLLTDSMGGVGFVISAVLGLIAALVGVSILKGKLKQAKFVHDAGTYVKDGSFGLSLSYDHFLYETVTRTKIQTSK